ncbi:MAG: hypothetical protein ACR2P6_00090 [Gammaproteobacteria bacterium]
MLNKHYDPALDGFHGWLAFYVLGGYSITALMMYFSPAEYGALAFLAGTAGIAVLASLHSTHKRWPVILNLVALVLTLNVLWVLYFLFSRRVYSTYFGCPEERSGN